MSLEEHMRSKFQSHSWVLSPSADYSLQPGTVRLDCTEGVTRSLAFSSFIYKLWWRSTVIHHQHNCRTQSVCGLLLNCCLSRYRCFYACLRDTQSDCGHLLNCCRSQCRRDKAFAGTFLTADHCGYFCTCLVSAPQLYVAF